MKNTDKSINKLWLIWEICYFESNIKIANRITRANNTKDLIREIAQVNNENLCFTLYGKNKSVNFGNVIWSIAVKDWIVTIKKEMKSFVRDWVKIEWWKKETIQSLIN